MIIKWVKQHLVQVFFSIASHILPFFLYISCLAMVTECINDKTKRSHGMSAYTKGKSNQYLQSEKHSTCN